MGGEPQEKNILEQYRYHTLNEENIFDVIMQGYKGVWCAEAGGPEPAEGCAGRGVHLALDSLKKFKVYEKLGVDLVIYDVVADVVCGGFAQPMRGGFAKEIYFVTSGELMAIYSTNNLSMAIAYLAKSGAPVRVAGIIVNQRGVEREEELMEEFAQKINVDIIGQVPRSPDVQEAEGLGGTVMEKLPNSKLTDCYRSIAKEIKNVDLDKLTIPTPIELEEIMALLQKYQAL
jgi:nitrogenase iron protein NifH